MPKAKTKKASPIDEVTSAVEDVLVQARGVLNRGWKQLQALPDAPEKMFRDVNKRVDRIVKDVRKNRKDLTKRVEKAVAGLDRRRQRVLAQVEKRGSRLVGAAEERTAEVLKPLAKRLDIASDAQVQALRKRLARLESSVAAKARQPRPRRKAA